MNKISSIALTVLASATLTQAEPCWQDAYGRGVGKVITTCHEGWERNGALCYPNFRINCEDGYHGVGPVCWQRCPGGFTDTGIDCLKPKSYGRGVGYALWHKSKCQHDHPEGCEKWGALYYPKCREGFHNAACCICSPNCINGQTDIGVSCQKKTYGRGAGKPLGCSSGLEESGALCYPPCKPGYHGNGPVCWENCPAGKHSCGALCTDSADQSINCQIKSIVSNVFEVAVEVAIAATTGEVDIPSILKHMGGAAIELANAVCDKPAAFYDVQKSSSIYNNGVSVSDYDYNSMADYQPINEEEVEEHPQHESHHHHHEHQE